MFSLYFFFFNDTATTEIYTLSLHDALPISRQSQWLSQTCQVRRLHEVEALVGIDHQRHIRANRPAHTTHPLDVIGRSEEHTSELQSRQYLVCRLLLEKKKNELATTQILFIH